MTVTSLELLKGWLRRQLPGDAAGWLEAQALAVAGDESDRTLFLAISFVHRRIGKADLALSTADLAAAEVARPGWRPAGWSLDQAARVFLLLAAGGSGARFAERLEQLFATADIGELIAFYRGLPLYPDQPRYLERAAEGVRTNMKAVFEAVAHNNPYPSEQFSESRWNQMIVKALFIGSTLYPVEGLERRWNPDLTRMLCDYAHERWAAGRAVSYELWRGVGRHADKAAINDLARVFAGGGPVERQAAALALGESPHREAASILGRDPTLAAAVRGGQISWQGLAAKHLSPS
ncbi:MAG: EboA domain-containing protein [Xanthobacteraceae bacterium]